MASSRRTNRMTAEAHAGPSSSSSLGALLTPPGSPSSSRSPTSRPRSRPGTPLRRSPGRVSSTSSSTSTSSFVNEDDRLFVLDFGHTYTLRASKSTAALRAASDESRPMPAGPAVEVAEGVASASASASGSGSNGRRGGGSGGGGGGGGGGDGGGQRSVSGTKRRRSHSPPERQPGGDSGSGNGAGAGSGSGQGQGGRGMEEEEQGIRYVLTTIQQPNTGSAFGTNVLARLPIAPPLIVQLKVYDSRGEEVSANEEMPFLICHCSLLTASGLPADMLEPVPTPIPTTTEQTEPPPAHTPSSSSSSSSSSRRPSGSRRQPPPRPISPPPLPPPRSPSHLISGPVRMLYGSVVSSPHTVPDLQGRMGNFFVFPEISVRARGRYRLQVRLMRLPRPTESPISRNAFVTEVQTAPFEVHLAENYLAPFVTDITRHFARAGVGQLLPPGSY